MSLISETTPVTALHELDLFTVPPVQTSIESTVVQEIRPATQLNTGGHIELIVNNNFNEYVRPNDTTLHVKFRVNLSKTDKSTVTETDWKTLSMVNNVLHSLWSQVDLYLGDIQTTISLQTYPYRSYFENLLYSTERSRQTFLECAGFYEDDLSKPDLLNDKRYELIKPNTGETDLSKGKIVEFEAKLHLDLLSQHKFLVGGNKMKIVLIPNKQEFIFMTSNTKLIPRIEFLDLYLNVRKSKVSDELLYGHVRAQDVAPVRYPLTRTEVRAITIDKNVLSRNLENVVNGQLPRRVYLAFVANDAYSCSYTKNPYNFQSYNISSLACFVNGEQFPRRAFTPNFESNLYTREYLELLNTASQYNNDSKMIINKSNFRNGYTIFGFDLSPDYSDGHQSSGYVNIPRNGVLRFEIQFAKNLETTITALVFCEFDNLLTINSERNVYLDYH